MLYSEQFDDATWIKNTVTVTADQVRGPGLDTTLNADLLTPTGADSYIYQDATATVGVQYTCSWYLRSVTGVVNLSIYAYDQAHTTILGTNAIIVTPNWQRFYVAGVLVAGDTDIGCSLGGSNSWVAGENIFAVRAQAAENNEWNRGPGVYHLTTANDKPLLDLADALDPTIGKAFLQDGGGNKLEARTYNDSNQWYSLAHDPIMNINDQNHTYTIVARSTSANNRVMISHGTANTDGMWIEWDPAGNDLNADYQQVGGSATPTVAVTDNMYHIIQVRREDDFAEVCVDGVCGAAVDVTGFGIDGASTFYVGAQNGASSWGGTIGYVRVDTEALSDEELEYDRQVLWGLTTEAGFANPAWTFTRATAAYQTFSAGGAHAIISNMSYIDGGHPRVSDDGGGVLIEKGLTNYCLYSQEFDQGAIWVPSNLTSVTADGLIAPDGATTADGLVADAVNTQHYVGQTIILSATTYTFSVYAMAGDFDWVYLENNSVANANAYFNLAMGTVGTVGAGATAAIEPSVDGYYRCSITFTGTVAQHVLRIYSAEADTDHTFAGDTATENTWIWQAQIERSPYATSAIPTTVSQISRAADSLTFDPHEANTTKYVLATEYNGTTSASKLTIYFEAKCLWANDDGKSHTLVAIGGNAGTAGSARNRLRFLKNASDVLYMHMYLDSVSRSVAENPMTADPTEWHSYRGFIDFADLIRSEFWVDDVSIGNFTAGTDAFDTTNVLIRIGQQYNANVDGDCRINNLLIWNAEVRP